MDTPSNTNSGPSAEPRIIVLFFDDADRRRPFASNLMELFAILEKGDPRQLVYYQGGGSVANRVARVNFSAKLPFLFNPYRYRIMDGYRFIMAHYKDGDKICIFGFSYGGYVALALAGMLAKVGLLAFGNVELISFAYDLFKNANEKNSLQCDTFKKTFASEVKIKFVGIWDALKPHNFIRFYPAVINFNAAAETFRHAVALDERRALFTPYLYEGTTFTDKLPKTPTASLHYSQPNIRITGVVGVPDVVGGRLETQYADSPGQADVLEVWFAGCHDDIGGSTASRELMLIPLRWMIQQCSNTGIRFRADARQKVLADPTQDQLDQKKYTSQIHDPLKMNPHLWIFEVLPIFERLPRADGTFRNGARMNLGRSRMLLRGKNSQIKVHKSVMEVKAISDYKGQELEEDVLWVN